MMNDLQAFEFPWCNRRIVKEIKVLSEKLPPTVSIALAPPDNHEAISTRNARRKAVAQAAWRRVFMLANGHSNPESLLYRLDRGKMLLRIVISFMETTKEAVRSWPQIAPKREQGRFDVLIAITDVPQSPYNNGLFSLTMDLPHLYPFKAPSIRFKTPIFHPRVYAGGDICHDITTDNWSPVRKFIQALLDVRTFLLRELTKEEISDFANREAADLYSKDRPAFNLKARQFTIQHAQAQNLTCNIPIPHSYINSCRHLLYAFYVKYNKANS